MADVRDRLRGPADTRLLWEVCQIPDFRKVTPAEHASLCVRLFGFLQTAGGAASRPTGWRGRSRASTEPTATSTRSRSGWPTSAPGPTSRSAGTGSTTPTIGATRPAR